MRFRIFGKFVCGLIIFAAVFLFVPLCAQADESAETSETEQATEISGMGIVTDYGGLAYIHYLFDGSEISGSQAENAYITLESQEGIGSLYVRCTSAPAEFTVTDNTSGVTVSLGEQIFLHQFVDLYALFGAAPSSITINFGSESFRFTELNVFTMGNVPDFVQKWEAPAENGTDLLLLSAHGDDEQIFFAGILPYYACELDYQVQVVYLTNHYNTEPFRVHEMLNGLWAAGVDIYPVFAPYTDFLTEAYDISLGYQKYLKHGITRDDLLGFITAQLRRFKPQVAITHDFQGEYGHPQHMICADVMSEAVTISNDPNMFPESAEAYGIWDVPKTYIHLYEENPIVLDLDQPLESFDGMTAFDVSKKLSLPLYASQYPYVHSYVTHFETAAQMRYSPCFFGLYRSTVGEDLEKSDFFENVLTYEQRMEEEKMLAEKEKLAEESGEDEAYTEAAEVSGTEEPTNAAQTPETEITPDRQNNPDLMGIIVLVAAAAALLGIWYFRKKNRRSADS